MIAPLRRAHRVLWTLLAVLLPVLLWVALSDRPATPAVEAPAVLEAAP